MVRGFGAGGLGRQRGGARAEAPTDLQLREGVRKGADYLLSVRKPNGTWEGVNGWDKEHPQPGAETALVLRALLRAGDMTDDPRLAAESNELSAAVKYVLRLKPTTTYAAAEQAMAAAMLRPQAETTAALEQAKEYLVGAMHADGSYGYSTEEGRPEEAGDPMNAQFAVQGMRAAVEAGVAAPASYWGTVDQYWRKLQLPEGGWSESAAAAGTARAAELGMSARGLASVLTAGEFLDTEARLTPRGQGGGDGSGVGERGVQRPGQTSGTELAGDLAAWRGVERVALACGLRRVGATAWYPRIAGELLRTQGPRGEWSAAFWSGAKAPSATYGTAEALLFLADGGAPVLFSKLRYDGPWDARPRDDANLSNWLGQQFEEEWNWRVVNVQAPAEEFLEAPVLLITGSKDPKFTAEDVARLRGFVNGGGLILLTADGGSAEFTEAVTKKYAPQVAQGRYAMRELAGDNPVLGMWSKVGMSSRLLGMSNGVRELWIHSPQDLGAAWEGRRLGQKDAWTIGANVYYYATGKGLAWKRPGAETTVESAAKAVRKIEVARVEYAGNWDPEPEAWVRMTEAARGFRTELTVTTRKIAELDAQQTPVADLTGTAEFTLSKEDVAALRAYLDGGGMLLADAAGGSEAFGKALRELAAELYPDTALTPLPLNHAIYNGALPDTVRADRAEYTRYTVSLRGPSDVPRLLGVVDDKGRAVIVFSPDDLTHALLGTNTWGIVGYDGETARRLVRNILLVATQRTGAEARAPSATREATN